jgi:hypothetical protein
MKLSAPRSAGRSLTQHGHGICEPDHTHWNKLLAWRRVAVAQGIELHGSAFANETGATAIE